MSGDPEVLGAARKALDALEREVRYQIRNGFPGINPMAGVSARHLTEGFAAVRSALDTARDSRPVGEGLAAALAVYGLLVGRCGADEVHRDAFVSAWTAPTDMPFEWRFQGSLGFGGKVYRNAGRIYASCYREDETPERLDSIRSVNLWLDRLSRLQAGPAAVRPATEDGLDTAATSETITAQGLAANRIDSLSPDGEELGPPAVGRTDSRRA